MHIQLSISPHCPSFLINALLVGVNKHIHSGPKTHSTLCLKSAQGGNTASITYMKLHLILEELPHTLAIYN